MSHQGTIGASLVVEAFAKIRRHFYGPVYRKDGIIGPLALDFRPLLWYPDTTKVIVRSLAKIARRLNPEAIAGGVTGGAIWGAFVASYLNKPFILVRKEPRPHGVSRGMLEGNLKRQRVVLIDDGFVRGEMKNVFSSALTKAGCKVVGHVVISAVCPKLVHAWSRRHHVPLLYLTSYQTILNYLKQHGYIDNELYTLDSAFAHNPYGWHKDKRLYGIFNSRLKRTKRWVVTK